MSRVLLVLPSVSDPAHAAVARGLAPELRRLGHEVRMFPWSSGRAGTVGRRGLEGLLRHGRFEACHVQFFSRGLGRLADADFPPGCALILTHQGASVSLLEHPRVFADLVRRASWVTAVSRAGAKDLEASFPEVRGKLAVVPNGASTHRGVRQGPGRRPFMLTVGRLAAYKGLDILALAFADLVSEGLELEWVAVGPDQTGGEFARYVRKLGLERRVRLTGPLPRPKVLRLLGSCLFFTQPSRQENCPMALLEAMAAGKASAAAAVGGVPELVRHGVTGLLVEGGRLEGLRAAMRRLAGDPALRKRLGEAARERVSLFSWARAAAGYAALYRRSRPKITGG